MQAVDFHSLPSPMWSMWGSKLEPGDVVQIGDRCSSDLNGWVPITAPMVNTVVATDSLLTYIRPVTR